jgi:hypothetical protein
MQALQNPAKVNFREFHFQKLSGKSQTRANRLAISRIIAA